LSDIHVALRLTNLVLAEIEKRSSHYLANLRCGGVSVQNYLEYVARIQECDEISDLVKQQVRNVISTESE
jgi:hypothetical protein